MTKAVRTMKTIGAAVVFGVFLQGCVTFVSPRVSSMNYDPTTMDILGKASGETTAFKFLGLTVNEPDGELSSEMAISKALSATGGDALINTVIDVEQTSFLGIFDIGWETIRASGTAVSFKREKTLTIHTSVGGGGDEGNTSPPVVNGVRTIDHPQP